MSYRKRQNRLFFSIRNFLLLSICIFSCSSIVLISVDMASDLLSESNQRDPIWFYNNLTPEDRKKIRQAIDYLIPREQIIVQLYQGLAAPLATDIAPNVLGHNSSVQPREFNATKAQELLKEVFGENASFPYFNMTLVAPATSVRYITPWAHLVESTFEDVGINVELKWQNYNIIMPRIYLKPIGRGYDYNHGGVDAWCFIEYGNQYGYPDPDISSTYYKENFPPTGNNAIWIENEEVRDIINRSLVNSNFSDRLEALSEFQHWFYEIIPKSFIIQELDIFVVDEELEGFDGFLIGKGWCFNNWTIGSQTNMTYIVPEPIFGEFNPILANCYDECIAIPHRNVFGTLAQRRGSYNISHPVPQIAKNWTYNDHGTIWEVKVRNNIKWSDGTNLTTADVLFTYHSVFKDVLDSPYHQFFVEKFPNNTSSIYLKENTSDTIIFELKEFFPYVESQIFNLPIIQKSQWQNINYRDWKTNPLNTGIGNEFPIGCGPYMIIGYNQSDIETIILKKNPYFNQSVFGHNTESVGGGIWFGEGTFDTIYIKSLIEVPYWTADNISLSGLASGVIDVVDSRFMKNSENLRNLFEELNVINNEYNSKCIISLDYRCHALNYNHYSPIWGINPHDPNKMYPSVNTNDIIDSFTLSRIGFFSISSGALILLISERVKTQKKDKDEERK